MINGLITSKSFIADDITLILLDLDSVKNSSTVINKFSNCAGLKMNVDKTKAKYIGTLMSCNHFPHGRHQQKLYALL